MKKYCTAANDIQLCASNYVATVCGGMSPMYVMVGCPQTSGHLMQVA